MITAQEIREKIIDKAVFGGYDMGVVDELLESIAGEVEALQRENTALKGKMKVLVDKIEEYRGNEGALNMAILSAQKLSVQIESDARARAASIISEAEAKAAATIGSIDERIATEEARLQAAKISTAKFFESARNICQAQLNDLDAISIANRAVLNGAPAEEAIRIPSENIANRAPVAEASDHTQVFSAAKDI